MYRRALLSAGAAGLAGTTGCLGASLGFGSDCVRSVDLELRSVTDTDIAAGASDALSDLSPPVRAGVTAAHRGDDATIWLPESATDPLAGVTSLALDDAYVTVSAPVASTVDRTGYEAVLEAGESAAGGRTVAFDELPAVDRTALYVSFGYDTFRKLRAAEDARSITIDHILAYPDDDAESRSALVPDPAYDAVRIDGRAYRFRITGTRPVEVETRRVEVETVARSTTEFAGVVTDRFGVGLDEYRLSADQRDILAAARDEGYDECAPYSRAYADLQEILGHEVPASHVTGTPAGVADADGEERDRERIDYANYRDRWYAVQLYESVV